jgi:hypothetical protein
MSWGKDRWCTAYSVENPDDAVQPEYFEEAYFAGLDLAPQQAADRYGGLVPLVLLYRVNYPPPG